MIKGIRVAIALGILGMPAIWADTVYLNNGDVMSGVVQQLDATVLTLETGYAGVVVIQREAIDKFTTDTTVPVMLEGNQPIVGQFIIFDQAMILRYDDVEQPIEMTEIAAVGDAPVPETAGDAPKLWTQSVDFGAALRKGNTDTVDVTVAYSGVRVAEKHTLTLGLVGVYGEVESVLNTRRGKADAKWQYYPEEKYYWYTQLGAERDEGRKLDLRMIGGVGIGYDLWKEETTALSMDVGILGVMERWAPYTPWEEEGPSMPTRTEEYMNIRLAASYTRQLFGENKFTNDIEVLPNLEEMGELRLSNIMAFVTPLSERLSLKTSLTSTYDSLADQSGVEEWDHYLVTSLRLEF